MKPKTKYWADHYIHLLQQGKTVQFRSREASMAPLMAMGDLVTIVPSWGQARAGDIVLCKIERTHYLRVVLKAPEGRWLVGDTRNQVTGWTTIIYGVVTKVEK